MQKTKVFISSTCSDLQQIRRDLEEFIRGLGYEPVMSDSKDASIPRGFDKIDACKYLVGTSDIFVLIIGRRYGNIEPETEKSITNLEYETALEMGKPIYAFVEEKTWQLRTTYQTLKKMITAGEFSEEKLQAPFKEVEDVRVFDFIEQVSNSKKDNWIKEFKQASDIINFLKENWSSEFHTLLEQRKAGKLYPLNYVNAPSLKMSWMIGSQEFETLSVPALPEINKEEILMKFNQLKPPDQDISIVQERLREIVELLRIKNWKQLELPEAVENAEDVFHRLLQFTKWIDSLIQEISAENGFQKFKMIYELDKRVLKPNFMVKNEGTTPAMDVLIKLERQEKILFLDKTIINQIKFNFPATQPEGVRTLIELAKNFSYYKNKPIDVFKNFGNDLSNFFKILTNVTTPTQQITSLPSNFNLIQHLKEIKLTPEYSIKINLQKVKHHINKIVNNDEIFLVNFLAKEETAEIPYICYADNLPSPSKGVLKLEGNGDKSHNYEGVLS